MYNAYTTTGDAAMLNKIENVVLFGVGEDGENWIEVSDFDSWRLKEEFVSEYENSGLFVECEEIEEELEEFFENCGIEMSYVLELVDEFKEKIKGKKILGCMELEWGFVVVME